MNRIEMDVCLNGEDWIGQITLDFVPSVGTILRLQQADGQPCPSYHIESVELLTTVYRRPTGGFKGHVASIRAHVSSVA